MRFAYMHTWVSLRKRLGGKDGPCLRVGFEHFQPYKLPPFFSRPFTLGTRRGKERSKGNPTKLKLNPFVFNFVSLFAGAFCQITRGIPRTSSSARENLTIVSNPATMVFWIFGYGSLVWNPGFEYDEKMIGFIKDYRRVFDLACIDHRGTPEHPARTCTLEAKVGTICWGTAYCVRGSPEKERLAMEYLERRECEYDQKTLVEFYKEGDSVEPALTGVIVFTSTPDKVSNKYYLGPAPLEEMASQIATAFGPCGNNRDYLFLLEKAMSAIGHEDDMVIELANEVRKVLAAMGKASPKASTKERKLVGPSHSPLKSHISTHKVVPLPEAIAMDS